jgi:hypothetical protein
MLGSSKAVSEPKLSIAQTRTKDDEPRISVELLLAIVSAYLPR